MEMTFLSTEMLKKAQTEIGSVEEAISVLRKYGHFRTLADKLGAFSKGRNLRAILTAGLIKNHPEINPDSVDRKVRNWLSGRQDTIGKKDVIELCFILELDVNESDDLLAMITDEGFHGRDPDEIPYIFALTNGFSYERARALSERVSAAYNKKDSNISCGTDRTNIISREISEIYTEEKLIEYVANERGRLGRLHNTAYSFFTAMMDKLENPVDFEKDEAFPENTTYTVGMIARDYLHGDFVKGGEKKGVPSLHNALKRSIGRNWPDEYVLSRIKNRHQDVTRKVLILLFLATYDAGDDELYYDEEESTPEEESREFYIQMNNMLVSCGFNRLDPRSSFDWIIIYCIFLSDSWEIDSTLSAFLENVFSDDESGNEVQKR